MDPREDDGAHASFTSDDELSMIEGLLHRIKKGHTANASQAVEHLVQERVHREVESLLIKFAHQKVVMAKQKHQLEALENSKTADTLSLEKRIGDQQALIDHQRQTLRAEVHAKPQPVKRNAVAALPSKLLPGINEVALHSTKQQPAPRGGEGEVATVIMVMLFVVVGIVLLVKMLISRSDGRRAYRKVDTQGDDSFMRDGGETAMGSHGQDSGEVDFDSFMAQHQYLSQNTWNRQV